MHNNASIIEYSCLPTTLISLDDWILVSIHGPDTLSYLQGQLTFDISKLSISHHFFAAHCNVYGKLLSNIIMFYHNCNYSYIVRKEIIDNQLYELKKYAVFSKIKFIVKTDVLLGLAGFKAREILLKLFKKLPNKQIPVMQYNEITLLWFNYPSERFLIITNFKKAESLKNKLVDYVLFNNSNQWLSLDLEAGYPIIDLNTYAKFIPQAVNMQLLGAISFNKGCYIGQEIIARTQYRKTNKHKLYLLSGTINTIPKSYDSLELKINKNWRRIGKVLTSVKLNNGTSLIQAVLTNNVNCNDILRIPDDTSGYLTIKPLPYE
ncbi:MAG: tRNA-modifying protein YgfZ [Pantoea sp. Brub]|nr:tRNA-modifying protein YgfZ [Pantoea sp. Brub]